MEKPNWTGTLLGKMHNAGITRQDIANKLGIKKSYMTMIFNGERTPKDIEQKCINAFDEIMSERA